MNKQKYEEWLDELIARTINTAKPQFRSEEWKQKYPGEFEVLLSRRVKAGSSHQSSRLRIALGNPIAKLAAAATVMIAVLFVVERIRREPEPTQRGRQAASAVEMATAISLERAYRRGGMEAVEDQCRKVFGTTAGESTSPSILQLLGEQNAGVKIFGGENL
ncbi:MAG: hypothetical protein ACYS0H_17630 [Planctomycetota bacterium]|jgi:hypothetical protein